MKLELEVTEIKQFAEGGRVPQQGAGLHIETDDVGMVFLLGDTGFRIQFSDIWLLTTIGERAQNEINRKRYEAQIAVEQKERGQLI